MLLGVISPTHDAYAKSSLISSRHRLAMGRLAVFQSSLVKLSDRELKQKGWSRTRLVLDQYSMLGEDGRLAALHGYS